MGTVNYLRKIHFFKRGQVSGGAGANSNMVLRIHILTLTSVFTLMVI
jgi:hypothetical protein